MVLILNERDVSDTVSIGDVIPVVEQALKDYSEKMTIMPPRYVMEIPDSPGTVRVMLAALPAGGVSGLKALTGTAGKRRENSSYFVIMLFESDGAVRSIMSANRLTQLRTGAASAVATKYLARSDSKVVGIIGGGVQGLGQVEGVCHVLRFEKGLVFDIAQSKAEQIVSFAEARLRIKFEVSPSPTDVVRNSDVLITATTATQPVVHGSDVKPGAHLNAIGSNTPTRRELDDQVLNKSKVIVDSLEQVLKESGDLIQPTNNRTYKKEQIYGEIGEIISGKKPGRLDNNEVTLFKSIGIAAEDVAAAQLVYSLAIRKGIGKEIEF